MDATPTTDNVPGLAAGVAEVAADHTAGLGGAGLGLGPEQGAPDEAEQVDGGALMADHAAVGRGAGFGPRHGARLAGRGVAPAQPGHQPGAPGVAAPGRNGRHLDTTQVAGSRPEARLDAPAADRATSTLNSLARVPAWMTTPLAVASYPAGAAAGAPEERAPGRGPARR